MLSPILMPCLDTSWIRLWCSLMLLAISEPLPPLFGAVDAARSLLITRQLWPNFLADRAVIAFAIHAHGLSGLHCKFQFSGLPAAQLAEWKCQKKMEWFKRKQFRAEISM